MAKKFSKDQDKIQELSSMVNDLEKPFVVRFRFHFKKMHEYERSSFPSVGDEFVKIVFESAYLHQNSNIDLGFYYYFRLPSLETPMLARVQLSVHSLFKKK